jgi:hypothetical protein
VPEAPPINKKNNPTIPPPPNPTSKPTTPTPPPTTQDPNQEDIPTDKPEEIIEDKDPEEAEQEADQKLPKSPQNPFTRPDIDKLIEAQFNEDMFRLLKGGLPCLETSAVCLEQLQTRAIAQSPLLREIDTRVQEANDRINEAKKSNKKNVRLAILSPALQYLLGPTPAPGQPQAAGTGLIDNVMRIITGNTGLINGLLRVIGIPLFEGSQGGGNEATRNNIAIGDLQIKVAELQRGRAKLADDIKKETAIALVLFDEAKSDFQTAQIVGSRSQDLFKVFELRYVRGNSDTESFLRQQNLLDNEKAQVYKSWAKMRRELFKLKLIVLSIKDAEI